MKVKTDLEIINWLEDMHNLHTTVEVLYVVDGYLVSLCWDGSAIHEFHGVDLREAYTLAMEYRYDCDRRRFVQNH